ncbi:Polyketide cyclase / dehydrase and lipid transport [compost metagenome]
MIKKILLSVVALVAVLVVGVLGLAATKPDTFVVERSATINATPETVYALLSDFHQWEAWSPWEKLDPAMKRTYEGAPSGVGAAYAWEGNDKAGKGRMEISEAVAPSKVVIKLNFIVPFEAHNLTEFTLTPDGEAQKLTWKMSGPQPFVAKVMCVFMDMDAMIGKDFEGGLAALKAIAEK